MSWARTTAEPAADSDVVLDLRDASFGYGEHPVVSGINLQVRRGEIVAILGANGSGKSTLMKGILGLNQRISGSVQIFGDLAEDLRDRARLGYVPQRHTLSSSIRATAEEIVFSGRLPRLGWLGRAKAIDRQVVCRSLDVVGLADRSGAEVGTLSGGQQRRVLIARALASQPEVLLMDEPTAGVDAANQHVLADVLRRLIERDVTMVIVTHELGPLESLLTRIVVVDNGGIAFDGPPQRFTAERSSVLHEHDSHHHDLELHEAPARLTHGPIDPDGGSRG